MVNVGQYTSPMDAMGHYFCLVDLPAVHCEGIPLKCGVGPHPSTRLEGAFG